MPNLLSTFGKSALRALGLMEEAAPKAVSNEIVMADMSNWKPPQAIQGRINKRIHQRLYGVERPVYTGLERRVSQKLKERPTTGLVNHVLGDSKFYKGHSKFMGKSY